jgi:hypothetical protein
VRAKAQSAQAAWIRLTTTVPDARIGSQTKRADPADQRLEDGAHGRAHEVGLTDRAGDRGAERVVRLDGSPSTELLRALSRNWRSMPTSFASVEPYAAVAMKQASTSPVRRSRVRKRSVVIGPAFRQSSTARSATV